MIGNLGPDYMTPVRTQKGATSDRSPYRMKLASVYMKPVYENSNQIGSVRVAEPKRMTHIEVKSAGGEP